MTQPRFRLIKVAAKFKLNTITCIGWNSSVGKELIQFRGCWIETAVLHYLSSNNVRLLAYIFTEGDPQSEWLKRNKSEKTGLRQDSYI